MGPQQQYLMSIEAKMMTEGAAFRRKHHLEDIPSIRTSILSTVAVAAAAASRASGGAADGATSSSPAVGSIDDDCTEGDGGRDGGDIGRPRSRTDGELEVKRGEGSFTPPLVLANSKAVAGRDIVGDGDDDGGDLVV